MKDEAKEIVDRLTSYIMNAFVFIESADACINTSRLISNCINCNKIQMLGFWQMNYNH